MSKKIYLKIVTPERLVMEELVDQVTLPTPGGEITILPDHVPFISSVASGDVVAVSQGEMVPMAIAGGFLEIKNNENNQTEVAILADFAEHVGDMSDEKIAEAKAKAEEIRRDIQNKKDVDFEHFAAELERSLTRIKISDKWKNRKYRK